MGVDWLDLTFRLEKRFDIKITRADFEVLDQEISAKRGHLKLPDVTAGEIHDWIVALCQSKGVKKPHSSWTRVRIAFGQTTATVPQRIHRETFIVMELGFS